MQRMWSAADSLSWGVDGRDWPNRDASRFVEAAGLKWHVQQFGSGPRLLLIHGTGASTHSWRDLAPLLAGQFEILAFDLPGHGFTDHPPAHLLTLPGMARGISQLIKALDFAPAAIAGHSAGAAIAARMCLDELASPRLIVSLNGALLPFPGIGRHLLPSLARILYSNTIAPRLMAWRARDRNAVAKLLEGTGSRIDARGVDLYHRLFSKPAHVAATLTMMASWDLLTLEADLPRLSAQLSLVVGALDRAIPAEEGLRPAQLAPHTNTHFVRGAGHLAHEERPAELAELIVEDCRRTGIIEAQGTRGEGVPE